MYLYAVDRPRSDYKRGYDAFDLATSFFTKKEFDHREYRSLRDYVRQLTNACRDFYCILKAEFSKHGKEALLSEIDDLISNQPFKRIPDYGYYLPDDEEIGRIYSQVHHMRKIFDKLEKIERDNFDMLISNIY